MLKEWARLKENHPEWQLEWYQQQQADGPPVHFWLITAPGPQDSPYSASIFQTCFKLDGYPLEAPAITVTPPVYSPFYATTVYGLPTGVCQTCNCWKQRWSPALTMEALIRIHETRWAQPADVDVACHGRYIFCYCNDTGAETGYLDEWNKVGEEKFRIKAAVATRNNNCLFEQRPYLLLPSSANITDKGEGASSDDKQQVELVERNDTTVVQAPLWTQDTHNEFPVGIKLVVRNFVMLHMRYHQKNTSNDDEDITADAGREAKIQPAAEEQQQQGVSFVEEEDLLVGLLPWDLMWEILAFY
eukprot:TRINITY_DN45792_c0_g1_i1.p1 TRINITY_DN45792_c0_g1~~TRINITY_DN45792_c0_g1_i1.p1  ORF type:complete len:323 (-),score=47.42 TRINITY_DN45792_c0_g1_i1:232-1137(-)